MKTLVTRGVRLGVDSIEQKFKHEQQINTNSTNEPIPNVCTVQDSEKQSSRKSEALETEKTRDSRDDRYERRHTFVHWIQRTQHTTTLSTIRTARVIDGLTLSLRVIS